MTKNPILTTVPVAALEVCDRTRVRAIKPNPNSDIVAEYAEAYQCGLITEPLDVFREKGTERYIVADGEHRLLALRKAGIKTVECRVHEGDELAALDFALGCNQAHGLRRTERDRYHAFARIMETPLRDKYRTDSELAEKLGVSIRTVKRYRAQWRDSDGGDARVRERKQAAREKAAKHAIPHSTPNVNVTRVTFQATENTKKISPAAHIASPAPVNGTTHIEFDDELPALEASQDWTVRDEQTYRALRAAWDAATMAARARFIAEARRGV